MVASFHTVHKYTKDLLVPAKLQVFICAATSATFFGY